MIRRGTLVLLSLVALTLTSAVVAVTTEAVSPHFVRANASLQGTNLVASWKEAGLGNNQLIHYVMSADATAQYACINGGGNHPRAANKETVSGPVGAEGDFSSGKNGSINGSLSVGPPGPGDFSCPPGQRLVLAQVIYSNISVTDATNGITETFASVCGSFVNNLPEFACPP